MQSSDPAAADTTRTLDELCALTQTPKRTVRYYIQMGLLDRPIGETRAARYAEAHLRRLLQIKQLAAAGFSLERIRERLDAGTSAQDAYTRPSGTIEQWTTLVIDDGVELGIDPDRATVSPAQVRALFREVLTLYARIREGAPAASDDDAG